MPWANGLGTTLELAIHPSGASMASMDWRVSIATVAEPGPFSSLPGVDRVLVLLDDVSAVLAISGGEVPMRRLDQGAFRGEEDVALLSVSAPASDLNLMTRRGRWRGAIEVVDLAEPTAVGADVTWLLVVSGTAEARAQDGARAPLAPLDLVLLDDALVTGTGEGVRIDLVRAS